MADKRRRSVVENGAERRKSTRRVTENRTENMGQRKRNNASANANKSRKNHSRKAAGIGNASGGKNRKKRKRSSLSIGAKIALGLCGVLLILVLAAIGVLASKMGKLKTRTLDADKLSISDELEYDETGYLNVALFGLDTRENNEEMGSRSDTIMIASLNRETKDVKLVSVYRDTLLQQDDGTYNKANAAYSFGEAEEAVAMLNRNLDMDIRHYVTVDFSALVDVIDALGGIEIEVTEEEIPYINGYAVEIIENTGVDTWAVTEPGLQKLTGVQATAYARIRYTTGDDFKRAERQRTVLTRIAEKAQGASLSTLNKIIDRVFPKVETNFTLPEILAYAKDVKKYNLCKTTGFPEDRDTMDYGDAGNVVIPVDLKDNVIQLHEYLFGDDGYSPTTTVKDISDEIAYLSGLGGSYDASGYSGYGTDYSDYSSDYGYSGYSDTSGYTDPYGTGQNTDTYGNYGNQTGNSDYGNGTIPDSGYGGTESGYGNSGNYGGDTGY